MMMAITKKLLYLLVADLATSAGKQAFLNLCATKKLKLFKPKGGYTDKHDLESILKKSRFQRTQYLTIIENWKDFVALLQDPNFSKVGRGDEVCRPILIILFQVLNIWAIYTCLIVEATNYEPDADLIKNWDELAKKFAEAFKARYGTEDFTPYMHIFVAHVGYWLKQHGDLESFANYDIESKNAVNKHVVHCATDRYGGKKQQKSHIAKQQLQYEFRQRENSLIVPKPMDRTVSKKQKKSRAKQQNKPNKRARTVTKTKPNWTTRTAKLVESKEFDNVYLDVLIEAAINEDLEAVKQETAKLAHEVENLCNQFDPRENTASVCNNNNSMDVTE